MELITVKKGQFKGYRQRWNIVDYSEEVEIPKGKYFKNGKQLVAALKINDKEYSLSSKHAYLIK